MNLNTYLWTRKITEHEPQNHAFSTITCLSVHQNCKSLSIPHNVGNLKYFNHMAHTINDNFKFGVLIMINLAINPETSLVQQSNLTLIIY